MVQGVEVFGVALPGGRGLEREPASSAEEH